MTSLRQAWIEKGSARLLSLELSRDFKDYLNALPWIASTLDWSRMGPFTEINISQSDEASLLAWAEASALGEHSHLAFCFSPKERCLLVPFKAGITHLDELFWEFPGVRFCFGADESSDHVTPCFDDLLQYGAGDILVATARKATKG